MVFSPKALWLCCVVQFWVSQDHRPAHCSVATHAQSHLVFRLRNKKAFFASSAHVAVELDSIFASGKHRESGVHGKMTFLFTTEYVKIRLQLHTLC